MKSRFLLWSQWIGKDKKKGKSDGGKSDSGETVVGLERPIGGGTSIHSAVDILPEAGLS